MSKPGYRVVAWAVAAGVSVMACRTPLPSRPTDLPTRIALISDLHIVTHPTNAQERLYPLRLDKTIEAVNAAKVDMVLAAGDLTEHATALEFAEFRRVIRRFSAPVFYVPGNHDLGNKAIPGRRPGTANFARVRNYELALGRSFFARERAGVRVIGVNSCILGTRLAREKQMWEFLERNLAAPGKVPTLLVQHHPPFLKNVDEAGGDYFNMEPYPRARLLALARQGGVSAILSGHLHRGLTNHLGNILLLTTPPVSYGLPTNKVAEGWMLLSVTGTNLTWDFRPLPKIVLSPRWAGGLSLHTNQAEAR